VVLNRLNVTALFRSVYSGIVFVKKYLKPLLRLSVTRRALLQKTIVLQFTCTFSFLLLIFSLVIST
jgi:hypothetical protein